MCLNVVVVVVVLFSRNFSTFLGGFRVCVCVWFAFMIFSLRGPPTYVCSSCTSS